MPYVNPEDNKRWLEDAMREGYGKRLYARRKLHRENALKFRRTLEEIISVVDAVLIEPEQKLAQIRETAAGVLRVVEEEEEELKGWKR